ncbi:MAG: hypothetical protein K8F30_06695, partial [Taibaiella sp.]|nr:hypothetical protein [Taibaiella sp.]
QSTLTTVHVMMPIMASLRLADNGKGSRMDFNLGGYLDYFISGKQKHKVGITHIQDKVTIDSRLNGGIGYELALAYGSKIKFLESVFFSVAMYYQLSQYLDNGKSYKPLMSCLQLGFTF